MNARLDPAVIDSLRERYELTSFEQIGVKLGRSGYTVRNWYQGKTVPSVPDLVKLQFLTGRAYGTMLLIQNEAA